MSLFIALMSQMTHPNICCGEKMFKILKKKIISWEVPKILSLKVIQVILGYIKWFIKILKLDSLHKSQSYKLYWLQKYAFYKILIVLIWQN